MTAPADGLHISDDLIFASKVEATARAKGLTVVTVRSADLAARRAAEAPPRCVLVDLNNPGLDLGRLLADLRAVCAAMPRVLGYGSHTDVETLNAARRAGCDWVMPRSKFIKSLEGELANWLAGPPDVGLR